MLNDYLSLITVHSSKIMFIWFLVFIITCFPGFNGENILSQDEEAGYVIDSNIDFEEAIAGLSIPQSIIDNLRIVDVYYYGFDDNLHKGQVVVHKDVVLDIIEIFEHIRETRFPIGKVVPISKYGWSDEKSMQDNNTSAFNYRFISGSRVISNHAAGLAIDINPALNPYIKNGSILPENCVYDTTKAGTIKDGSQLVKEFNTRGWDWGGHWKSLKDYQHFEKKLK
jgi:peptidoglycan LD-endopeptidase CwlK